MTSKAMKSLPLRQYNLICADSLSFVRSRRSHDEFLWRYKKAWPNLALDTSLLSEAEQPGMPTRTTPEACSSQLCWPRAEGSLDLRTLRWVLRAAAAAQSWHPESLVNEFARFSRTGEMSSAGAPAPWSEGRDPAHPKGADALVFGRVRAGVCRREGMVRQ